MGVGCAEGVDLDPGQPGRAAQVAVVGVLDAVLADLVARLQAPVARFLQLFFGDLADVAEDVGGQRPVRVVADEDPLDLDARKAVLVFLQVVDEVVADVATQGHRRRRRQLQFFVHRAAQVAQGAVGQLGEARELGPPLGRVGGQFARVDLQRQAGAVGDQHFAVAIEDLAARGADPVGAGAVVLRFRQILFAVEHLQQPEAEEEDGEEGNGKAAEDRDPQGQPVAHRGAALIGAQVHQVPPR